MNDFPQCISAGRRAASRSAGLLSVFRRALAVDLTRVGASMKATTQVVESDLEPDSHPGSGVRQAKARRGSAARSFLFRRADCGRKRSKRGAGVKTATAPQNSCPHAPPRRAP